MRAATPSPLPRQRGAAAVEFALVALLFFTLLFAVLEFGRMLYIYNTLQEVTRRAAREAVVRWVDQGAAIKTLALFGGAALPAGPEITAANISIQYLRKDGTEVASLPQDPGDNLSACGDITRTANCIYSVRVAVDGVSYGPMTSMFSFLNIALPPSVVVMHAESLGFTVN
ncbi:TadE/TadG family type IV pilus assembly protein [Janthinobacterium fluminis]|uniref:Pilus assembly protein n=1 Tax=Janthinobacterium fluminis TaxID=2987524 RepID=A0ABT5K4A0_9BURK|nr:TadE family protein [Janthinobacterium fluminis]MDC8759253.1 pilus assembly protein [Janthinobacterium fluminis]